MKKFHIPFILAACMMLATTSVSLGQEAADAAAEPAAAEAAEIADSPDAQPASGGDNVFFQVVFGSGVIGFLLWVALFGTMGFYIYLLVDSLILIRPSKIMPQALVDNVEGAMKEGDIIKALQFCENSPTPMANILSAGFSRVEEGFEVIEQAIGTAADIEIERINQKLTWFSVDSNIAPMLGLLGTVQGMILAFANISGGAPDFGVLAVNISQALWTTAAGLMTAIPAVCTFYYFRNRANRIVLQMEAITMELIKDLRNVEVVTE
ncbi:MAG: MotA/TolQ/ExbB proton channel family protein [Kiritimatiellia bacterium]|jgi:biopolymer transport protein ExbB